MGGFMMYCPLCGCGFISYCSEWLMDIVYLQDDNPANFKYEYDGHGRIIDKKAGKIINILDNIPKHLYGKIYAPSSAVVAAHRSCWIVCNKPTIVDIKAVINVDEFDGGICGQDFDVGTFLELYPGKKWYLDDPITNKENSDRIKFEFYKNKYLSGRGISREKYHEYKSFLTPLFT